MRVRRRHRIRPAFGALRGSSDAKLHALLTHVPADLPLGHLRAVLVHKPLPDPPRRVTLLARRLPIRLQNPVMIARYGPNFGAGRDSGERFADSNACLTARR